MPDILNALGIPEVAPAGVAETPTSILPETAAPASTVLARLSAPARAPVLPGIPLAPLPKTRGTGILSALSDGMSAKSGAAPSNKFAAVLDGLFTGVKGSEDARSAKAKQAMEVAEKLYNRERQATLDKRQVGLDKANEEQRAFDRKLKTRQQDYAEAEDPTEEEGKKLKNDKIRQELYEAKRQELGLTDDDKQAVPTLKLKPEDRAAREQQLAEYGDAIGIKQPEMPGAVKSEGDDEEAIPLPPSRPEDLTPPPAPAAPTDAPLGGWGGPTSGIGIILQRLLGKTPDTQVAAPAPAQPQPRVIPGPTPGPIAANASPMITDKKTGQTFAAADAIGQAKAALEKNPTARDAIAERLQGWGIDPSVLDQ